MKGTSSIHRATRPGIAARTVGFTRIDLTAVLAMIALLALIRGIALANSPRADHALICLNNVRQLALGWAMYVADNQGWLPAPWAGATSPPWVGGWVDFTPGNAVNTNTAFLLDPKLAAMGPYTKDARIYHCPEDVSAIVNEGIIYPRIRSYSMNSAMGDARGLFLPAPRYRTLLKQSDIVDPEPSNTWVFIDEHPDSINDGGLGIEMATESAPQLIRIIDYPAAYHDGGAVLAFADGHADLHKWVDPRTTPQPRFNNTLPLAVFSPNNQDMLWLSERTTRPGR